MKPNDILILYTLDDHLFNRQQRHSQYSVQMPTAQMDVFFGTAMASVLGLWFGILYLVGRA